MANILIIDDDSVLLKLYSTRLSVDGHQVATAVNGEDGLVKLQAMLPDIIILDLLMPKLNGFKFIEVIKQNATTAAIPIIVFSSVANQEQIARLTQLGIDTLLNKIETTPTQLIQVINQKLAAYGKLPSQ
jgi:adenylate cyclase